ncbi:MAG TPA: hypothetical protein VFA70_07145 [Dehalococcoidia bacterium]|nr:hypothetical protein [Dehalococcoidia bacterium]
MPCVRTRTTLGVSAFTTSTAEPLVTMGCVAMLGPAVALAVLPLAVVGAPAAVVAAALADVPDVALPLAAVAGAVRAAGVVSVWRAVPVVGAAPF